MPKYNSIIDSVSMSKTVSEELEGRNYFQSQWPT